MAFRELVITSLLLWSVGAQAALECPAKLSEVQRFDQLWSEDFSRFPSATELSPWLRTQLLERGQLDPVLKTRLELGADPLRLMPGISEALQTAYVKLIAKANLPEQKKEALLKALDEAVKALRKDFPPLDFGGGAGDLGGGVTDGGGGAGGGGGDELNDALKGLPEEIVTYIKRAGFRRCAIRTGLLFFVSNIINTAGALEMKWAQYAGKEDAAFQEVFRKETWDRAFADNDFRHNVTWNAMLMLSLGAFSCLDKNVGKNLMTAMTAGISLAGQYMTSGEISLRQTLVDTIFVRYISINKSNFVFRLAESYTRRGLPAPHVAELLFQGVSESIGAYAYPRVNRWTKKMWAE